MEIEICRSSDLSENKSFKFNIPETRFDREAFAVVRNGTVIAYYNECPHIGIALDWDDNDFFSTDFGKLVCKNHGAEFLPDNGLCVSGPCTNTHLKPIQTAIRDGVVYAIIENQTNGASS